MTDFGADPTGRGDATRAIRQALEAARDEGGAVRVAFAPGRYAIHAPNAERRELYISNTVGADPDHREKAIGILVEGFDDIEVDGRGAVLEFHGRQTTVGVIDTDVAELHDFTIDMIAPTVVELTVRDGGTTGERSFRILEVPPDLGWSIHGTEIVWHGEEGVGDFSWSGRGAMEYSQVHDPVRDRTWRAPCTLFDDVVSLTSQGRGILVEYSSPTPPGDVGLVYQLRNITRDHPGLLALDSGSVSIRDVCVGYLHGFGLVAQNGRDLVLERVRFQTIPGSGRKSAGFADFVQCSAMRGEIRVADCLFDGAHDDAINIHGTYLRIVGVSGRQALLEYAHPQTAGFPQFARGEHADVIVAATGEVIARALTVVEVSCPSGRDHERDLLTMSVAFEDLPDVVVKARAGTLAIENITRAPAVHICGNTFKNLPTRGVLVSTRKPIVIENNVFDSLGMAGILISSDASSWWESGPVTDCRISDNEFRLLNGPAVLIEPGGDVSGLREPVHGTIELLRNTVYALPEIAEPLVAFTSVAELTLVGNRVDGIDAGDNHYEYDPSASRYARRERCSSLHGGQQPWHVAAADD
ncbi:hypothetical protein ABH923_002901 [Leifsonia sp. EB41]|uniref:right-handed parallel beta-helix repeat-containing protein n=1 Tax=Leifsonia sp. EB41 TaxID=3156260 RepID=UPI003512610F